MENKSKYEVAVEILNKFGAVSKAINEYGSGKKINNTQELEQALEWYLKQLKKVLSTLD